MCLTKFLYLYQKKTVLSFLVDFEKELFHLQSKNRLDQLKKSIKKFLAVADENEKLHAFYQTINHYESIIRENHNNSDINDLLAGFEFIFKSLAESGFGDAKVGFPLTNTDISNNPTDAERDFPECLRKYNTSLRLLNEKLKNPPTDRASYLVSFFARRCLYCGEIFGEYKSLGFSLASGSYASFSMLKDKLETLTNDPTKSIAIEKQEGDGPQL